MRTTSILEIPEENSKCFSISVYRHYALREHFVWEQLLCYITEVLRQLPFPTFVNAPLGHIICELLLCEHLLFYIFYVTYPTRYSTGPFQLPCTRELAKQPIYIVPVQMWIYCKWHLGTFWLKYTPLLYVWKYCPTHVYMQTHRYAYRQFSIHVSHHRMCIHVRLYIYVYSTDSCT